MKIRILFLIILSAALASCSGSARIQNYLGSVSPENAAHLDLPSPERWTLSNGITVLFLHDPELPLMRGSLYVVGGGIFEPADEAGVATLTGSQIREGGIAGQDPKILDAKLDSLGATIESSFNEELGSIGFSSLSDDFNEVFGLFGRIIRSPGFDGQRLELAKKLSREGIARRREDPELIASATLGLAVYGPTSPYYRVATSASIAKISRADLQEFHERFVRPEGSYLALTGSLPTEVVKKATEEVFGDWRGSTRFRAISRNDIPVPTEQSGTAIYVVERDFSQAAIEIGHLGPARMSPDQFAISIFNRYFGMSGFESVLFSEIRSKLGLAYSVYGGFFPGAKGGLFEIAAGTRAPEAINCLTHLRRVVGETQQALPESAAITGAKEGVNRSFIFRFATSGAIVSRRAYLELFGYPNDFDRQYMSNIAEVSPADVEAVARERLSLERLKMVVVGKVDSQQIADALQMPVQRVVFDEQPKLADRIEPRHIELTKEP